MLVIDSSMSLSLGFLFLASRAAAQHAIWSGVLLTMLLLLHPSVLDRNPDTDRASAERSIGVETYGQTMEGLCRSSLSVRTARSSTARA